MGEKTDRIPKEWTLMFYFASDNPLAPNVIPQLKALKNAGYHLGVNVVLQFDPNVEDIPTHIFDVNKISKIAHAFEHGQRVKKALEAGEKPNEDRPYNFWRQNDPFIRNLVLDKLWNDNERELPLRKKVVAFVKDHFSGTNVDAELPIPESIQAKARANGNGGANAEAEAAPVTSLGDFIDFCIEKYPANHYMLFLLGHGLVVGNDMFMFDQNAISDFLNLRDFGTLLSKFQGKNLELVAFHSCGLSGLEIACELKGSAKYMIASQGEEFVGSWPYREILIRVFNDLIHKDEATDVNDPIRETIKKIFSYVLKSSYDFQLAGYSFDLALCDIRGVNLITSKLAALAQLLTDMMKLAMRSDKDIVGRFFKERILLAHWKAQSFWGESYTDLYDFCYCLRELCDSEFAPDAAKDSIDKIARACEELIKALESEDAAADDLLKAAEFWPVINAEFAGPEYQYSHGLSVYFPWAKPRNKEFWDRQYPNYKFNSAEEFSSGWAGFLNAYWEATMRKSIGDERPASSQKEPPIEQQLLERITSGFKDSSLFLGLCPVDVSDKLNGGSGLGADEKPMGGSGLGSGEKPIGGSGLGPGEKPMGGSGLGPGEKPLGGSGLGPGQGTLKLKPIGMSGLGAASGKPIGMSGLGSGDGKPFGGAGTGGCDCGSIKNYPLSTFPTSPGFYRVIRRGAKSD